MRWGTDRANDISHSQEDGVGSHPYGVEPLGNLFLSKLTNCKPLGLGALAVFDDERMLDLMAYLDASSLSLVSRTSRALYVYSHVEDLWKALVVEEMAKRPGESVPVYGGWKTTLIGILNPGIAKTVSHTPLKVLGFFSDLLYQPHFCASAPIRPEWLQRSTVDRCSDLSTRQFRAGYEVPNRPVILADAAARWPALTSWTMEELLKKHGDLRVHAGGLEFTMKDYIRYASETKDELPLYVFDKRFAEKCPSLGHAYEVPPVFVDDLFSVLGEESRPDYRWLIVGPARSGSSFHVDPNCTSAWNATVVGRKKWILFPPGVTPPGVHPSEDGLDLAAPVSIMEWFMNFYEECHAPERDVKPLECVSSPGEVVYVPRGWWHCVLNLEWSVALTQNYVSSVNLPHVLRFLLNRKHLISGLPPEERNSLGEKFVAALSIQRPDLKAADIAHQHVPPPYAAAQNQSKNNADSVAHIPKKMKLWDKLKAADYRIEDDADDEVAATSGLTRKRVKNQLDPDPPARQGVAKGFTFDFSFG